MNRHTTSTIVAAALLSIPLSLSPASAQSAPSTACGTPPAGYNVIETDIRFIAGTPGRDFICAGGSNNIIRAMGQDDIIFAGGGNDIIWGGYGNDTIWAGNGNDLVTAGGGRDAVSAGNGDDTVFGGTGADTLRGGDGNDMLTGGDGHDTVDGGAGADTLIGNKGIDSLSGGSGDDIGQGGVGTDTIVGGAGDDVLTGGDHDDVLGGGNGHDRLVGGDGSDELTGGNGDDEVLGGNNQDMLRGSAGDDMIDGGNGLNLAIGGDGEDECINADDPASICEVIDGINTVTPPPQVWTFTPSTTSSGVLVGGTGWSRNSAIDLWFLDDVADLSGAPTIVNSDAQGSWELIVASEDLDEKTILVSDRATGVNKTLERSIESFNWDPASGRLEVSGEPGETVTAQFFGSNGSGDLALVERIATNGDGIATAQLDDVSNVGVVQLRRSDEDGDIEILSDVTSGFATVRGPAATVVTLELEPVKN